MNDLDKWDGQYRRPQPHFTAEKVEVRPTIDRRRLFTGLGMLCGMALILALAMPVGTTVDDAPDAYQVRTDTQMTTVQGCQLIQHMTFTPCGHELTRRQALPAELVGKGREAITAAYDLWRVTSFGAAEVVMEQSVQLYCPDHMVLMADEGGMLCIFQNRYGDALGLVRETDVALNELPEAVQTELRQGKGFPTVEAVEQWLESVES